MTAVSCFQLDVTVDQSLDAALSVVMARVKATSGHILHLESFTEDVAILYVSIRHISYGVLIAMLSNVAHVTEKPLCAANEVTQSRALGELTGQLMVSTSTTHATV